MLDSYQRGNRDGLMSFAASLDDEAVFYDAQADLYEDKLESGPFANSATHRGVVVRYRVLAAKVRELAAKARRASEAIPLDPENPDLE